MKTFVELMEDLDQLLAPSWAEDWPKLPVVKDESILEVEGLCA